MLKALQRAKSIVQSPPTDSLPPALIEAKEKYLDAKSHLSQLLNRASALTGKLNDIRLRLEALPEEKRRLQMARRPTIVDQALDATKKSALHEIDAQLTALGAEEVKLKEEHEVLETGLAQMRCINGETERSQRSLQQANEIMWTQVAGAILDQAPPGLAEYLSRLWAAINVVKPASAGALVEYLGARQPDREQQIQMMAALEREFDIPVD